MKNHRTSVFLLYRGGSSSKASTNYPSHYLLALMLILLPLERSFFPYGLKVVDIAFVLLIFIGIYTILYKTEYLNAPLVIPFFLILIASLVACFNSISPSTSLIALIQEVYLFVVFISLTNTIMCLSSVWLNRLLSIWAIIAILEATFAVLGMLGFGPSSFYVSPYTGRGFTAGEYYRALATFANPNAAGAYLAIGFFVLLATSWPTWMRIMFGFYILLGIFSTGSLGALFSVIACCFILFTCYILNKSSYGGMLLLYLAVLSASLISVLLLMGVGPVLSDIVGMERMAYLSNTLGRLPGSVMSRMRLVGNAWPVFLRHPFGVGPNTFFLSSGSLHNDYIAFLAERGPIGFLGWSWLILESLAKPIKEVWNSRQSKYSWRILALWAGFLAFALNAMSHEVSHFRYLWVFMAFLFSVPVVLKPESSNCVK